ncbi:hypothetical protein ACQKL6_14335 [Peribacillus sp. NPDC097197]|uniref:hypothetical protein n=1 Tax=unclassified Peribacillus TaxID=2675266 RepID=UPI0038046ABB
MAELFSFVVELILLVVELWLTVVELSTRVVEFLHRWPASNGVNVDLSRLTVELLP